MKQINKVRQANSLKELCQEANNYARELTSSEKIILDAAIYERLEKVHQMDEQVDELIDAVYDLMNSFGQSFKSAFEDVREYFGVEGYASKPIMDYIEDCI